MTSGSTSAQTLPGRLLKQAYLGHCQELTVGTELGDIFVVAPDARQPWQVGQPVSLQLEASLVSVVSSGEAA